MYKINFLSTGSFNSSELQLIEANIQQAGARWDGILARPQPLTVNITVSDAFPRAAAGGPATSNSYKGSSTEPAASFALRSGIVDTQQSHIDVYLNESFLRSNYFLDPSPLTDNDIPSEKTDFTWVIQHEIGHALGFLGYTDPGNYSIGQFSSPFDKMIQVNGDQPYFLGENAMAVYGGPVPLTAGNVFHLGNEAARAGANLLQDLMNGVYAPNGVRGAPSEIDQAILADLGIGTSRSEILRGQPNDDNIAGGFGRDLITGGQGNDILFGNQDDDEIYGNEGLDRLFAGQGSDIVYGGRDNDHVEGNLGNDQIFGNMSADFLHGGQGNDSVYGGQDNDILNGGQGDDILIGGLGSDVFVFGPGQGADVVRDLRFAEGDRLDVQGQTYVVGQNDQGEAELFLNGGGTIVMQGFTPEEFQASFVA